MKKALLVLFALILSFSLVACGGVSEDDAIEAFNNASVVFGDVCAVVEADMDSYPTELTDELYELTDGMNYYKELLTSDEELSEEDLAEAIEYLNGVEERANEIKDEYGI